MKSVTQWFRPEEKPVHAGEYETKPFWFSDIQTRAKWDGRVWRWPQGGERMGNQKRRWRGLADKPEQSND